MGGITQLCPPLMSSPGSAPPLRRELITGKTPYSDNEYGSRALMKAVYHGKRPTFPENTLPAYK